MIDGIYNTGLQIHLDGIKNTGTDHSIDTLSWNNLVNNDSYSCLNSKWDKDGIYFYKKDSSFINLDQHNDYIFSFEVCFSLTRLADSQAIVSNAQVGGWELAFVDGRLQLSIKIGSEYKVVYGDILINTEKIYYITGTFDKRYIKLYNEGSLIGYLDLEKDYNMVFPQNNTHLILGGNPKEDKSTMMYFTGKIYSFRYYNIPLTEKNIKENYLIDSDRYPSINGEESYDWVNLNSKDIIIDEPGLIGKIEGRNFYKKNPGPAFVFVTYIQNYTGFILLSPNKEAVTFTQNDSHIFESNAYIYYDTMKWYVSINEYWMEGNHPISGFICLMHNFDSVYEAATYFLTSQKIQTSRKIKEEAPIEKDGRVKYVRVRASDGSYSNALAFLVSPENVDFNDGRSLNEHLDDKALESIYSENGINLGRKTYQDTEEENIEPGHHSSAIGQMVKATGQYSFATGEETDASGDYSRASGSHSAASGDYSAADGAYSEASGIGSHAEGAYTKATGDYSHAAGFQSESKGKYSTAIGMGTLAEGEGSFAIGVNTVAKGRASFAAGEGTIAASSNQFVHGKYNIEDTEDKYIEIIGNGTDDANRSNAFAIGKNGDIYIDGKVEAAKFDGPAIYDTKMQEIQDYVYDLEPKDDKLMVYKGSGEEIELDLSKGAWENIQEKIGSWHSKKPINISKSWGRIVNFGYINRTKWRSACVFYAQLVLFANPPADAPTFDVEFELRIDDVVVDETWRPKETLEKGYHVIHLMHPIRQIPPDKEVHMVTVWAKTTGGTISVDPGGAQAAFFGMGIDSGDVRWDGQVKCQDDFELQRYNITFEQDDKIHKGYTIQYKEKIKEFLRVQIIDNKSFKLHQKVYDKDASGKKTGWHYNITFAEDDYVFNMDDMVIGVHGLFTDEIRPNQDGIKAPDLTALTFRVLGDYIKKYKVNRTYITTETEIDTSKKSTTNILLNQNYSKTSQPIPIDEGKAIKLDLNFNDFKQIDVVQVKEVV